MTTSDQLLSEFIDAWNAGRRPRVREYLARLPAGSARDELADRLDEWLRLAPTPAYDAAARESIRAQPAVRALLEPNAAGGAWATVLPRLRKRSALSQDELAAALVDRFNLAAADAPRAAFYLDRLERGRLDPTRLSRRLLDALGALLGVSASWLAELAAPAPRAASALLRAKSDAAPGLRDDLTVLSAAALAPAPAPPDELDRLFTGGRDA